MQTIKEKNRIKGYPIITPKERLSIWKAAAGIWKNRKPDPIRELKKMRKEWDRPLPSLH